MYTSLHETQELIGRGDQVMGVESDVAEADVFAYIREFGGVVSGLLQEIEGV